MCSRYTLTETPEVVKTLIGLDKLEPFPPRYNIAPTQPILMVGINGASNKAPILVRWGLVPSWVKEPGEFSLLLNARSETAAEKPSFRNAMRHRRTLVPASGYYEWHRQGDAKQAYLIRPRDGGLITFGGLMETWSSPDGSEIDSGCILTTNSSPSLTSINHRMPVIIRPENFDQWLDCKTQEPRHVDEQMLPFDDDFFEAIPISNAVNKVTNSGPQVQKQVELEEPPMQEVKPTDRDDSDQMDLF